jgi:hypothetical protein
MTHPNFPFSRLPGRSIVAVEGPDAAAFLQGLVTADIQEMRPGDARYGALLTPQGKILFVFFVVKTAEGFLLDCAASQRDDLVKRLAFYKLRAKVTINSRDDLGVGVSTGCPPLPLHFADPRTALLGYRAIAPAAELPAEDEVHYRRARFQLGIADAEEISAGSHFPHEVNLDQLNGVSFSKGCYVGQEVVSRMQHRNTARARICPVKIGDGAVTAGASINAGERTIGTLLTADGAVGLAVIRLDRLEDAVAASQQLLTGGVSISVKKPDWAQFAIAGA